MKMPPVKPPITEARVKIFKELDAERKRQTEKWGVQSYPSLLPVLLGKHPMTTGVRQCDAYGLPPEIVARDAYERAVADGTVTWGHIFVEEVAEAFAATNREDMRTELIQALASGVQWLEDLDKKTALGPLHDELERHKFEPALTEAETEAFLYHLAGEPEGPIPADYYATIQRAYTKKKAVRAGECPMSEQKVEAVKATSYDVNSDKLNGVDQYSATSPINDLRGELAKAQAENEKLAKAQAENEKLHSIINRAHEALGERHVHWDEGSAANEAEEILEEAR